MKERKNNKRAVLPTSYLLPHTLKIVGFFILYSCCVYAQPAPVAQFTFDEGAGNEITETISGTAYSIKNVYPATPSEWVPGVSGTALRLNGYGSHVEGAIGNLPTAQLSLSLWFALETFPVGEGALFSVSEGTKGLRVTVNKFGNFLFYINAGNVFTDFLVEQEIERYQWNHLAVTLHPNNKEAKIYLNGELIAERTIQPGSLAYPSNPTLLIGKNTTAKLFDIFNTNFLNGLIDEIKLYDQALSQEEITTLYNQEQPPSIADVSIPSERFEEDIHRPKYHAIPAAGWMNEPHGLIYDNGEYHLFYQKNGNGPYWSQLNWGHLSSPDLIHWTDNQTVLWPQRGDDSFGCWSGAVTKNDDGTPVIMYTGVDGQTAQMMLAYGNETWTAFDKYEGNPVVDKPPAPYTNFDFRDPFIWKEFDKWHMVVGTGLKGQGNSGGAVVYYTSDDLKEWTVQRPFYKGFPDRDDSGEFWEMPVVWKFGDKHLLLVNPIPFQGKRARMLYWTGTFDGNLFVPDSFDPKRLGAQDGMLSPSFAYDKDGRTIAIGIVPDHVPNVEHRQHGWAHLMSLPRVLEVDGDVLLQKPHPNLKALRGKHHHFENIEVASSTSGYLEGIKGRHLEIKATIDRQTANRVGFVIAQAPDDSERTRVYYDNGFANARVERTKSSTNLNSPLSFMGIFEEIPADEDIVLNIFVDGSIVEVFINDRHAFATRIFPENPESTGLDLYVKTGQALFKTVDIWEMKPLEEVIVTSTKDLTTEQTKNSIKNIYPNPFQEIINIELELPSTADVSIQLYDLLGKQLQEQTINKLPKGKQMISFKPTPTPVTLYFLTIRIDGQQVATRLVGTE